MADPIRIELTAEPPTEPGQSDEEEVDTVSDCINLELFLFGHPIVNDGRTTR